MDFSATMVGFKEFQLAFVAVKLGLPLLLNKRPMKVDSIAAAVAVPADRLVRLLNALVWCEILKLAEDGTYSLAPSGSELVDDRPNSLSDDLRFQGEFLYRAFGELHDYLANGTVPFERAHGIGIFEYLAKHPDLARLYAQPMAQRCAEYSNRIASNPALDGAKVIVDVAGGAGQLLIDILKARPAARGILFDLPYMQPQATQAIAAAGLTDRCTFEPGNFFQALPADADVYLLKWILHDFDDAQAESILKNLAAAMSEKSKLLIIERLMPERISPEANLLEGDLNMLCLSGGAERTIDHYRDLCSKVGLSIQKTDQVETAYGFYLIEIRLTISA